MSALDLVQTAISTGAFAIQIYATALVWPLRRMAPKPLWLMLVGWSAVALLHRTLLMSVTLAPRASIVLENTLMMVSSLLISGIMLVFIRVWKQRIELENRQVAELACATLELAHEFKAEKSLAYQLAEHFAARHEQGASQLTEHHEQGAHPLPEHPEQGACQCAG